MQPDKTFTRPDKNPGQRIFVSALGIGIFLSRQAAYGADLSRYRQFQLGMRSGEVISHLAGIEPSRVILLYQRPEVVERLDWIPYLCPGNTNDPDPVHDVAFDFLNKHLYRIVVRYDPRNTEGMTTVDVVQWISQTYGAPIDLRPDSTLMLGASQAVDVLARWEDQHFLLSLFGADSGGGFGIILVSKSLDRDAQFAIKEAIRLDEQERPARDSMRKRYLA
jgi:hypothetical protein